MLYISINHIQMLLLIFFLSIIVADPNDFFMGGLYANFSIVPGSDNRCQYGDYSCNQLLCKMLLDTTRHISYVFISMISHNPSCLQRPLSKSARMITFGIDDQFKIVNTSLFSCDKLYDCMEYGCNRGAISPDPIGGNQLKYNDKVMWSLYTGFCQ